MTIAEVVALLRDTDARDEALVVVSPGGKILGIPRPDRWDSIGRAWRLGDHLLGSDGRVYRIGTVLRAVTPKDFNADKSVVGAQHRERQREAAKRGFEGDVVNLDFVEVPAEAVDVDDLRARAMLLVDPFSP